MTVDLDAKIEGFSLTRRQAAKIIVDEARGRPSASELSQLTEAYAVMAYVVPQDSGFCRKFLRKAPELSLRNQAIMRLLHQVGHLSLRLRAMRYTAWIEVDGWRV